MRPTRFARLIGLLGVLAACGGGGGSLYAACLESPRSPGRQVCSCSVAVADQVLSSSDQGTAAEILLDPDLFIEYQKSDRPSREAFVARYRAWGEQTAAVCAV